MRARLSSKSSKKNALIPPLKIVGKTTESVYFSCYILPGAFHLPEGLAAARARAMSMRDRDPEVFTTPAQVFVEAFDGGVRRKQGGEISFTVNRGGSASGYFFVLRNEDLSIEAQQSASVSSPAVYVQLRARLIWAVGYEVAVKWALALVAEMFGRVNKSVLSRVDFTVDVQGWDFRPDQVDRFVGRSKKIGVHDARPVDVGRKFFKGQAFTGVEFSKGNPLAANIYDKLAEIIAKKTKTWFYKIWKSNGWDGRSRIWRIEFQVKRPVLKEFGLTRGAIRDLDEFDGIFQYLTGEWLRFCIPDADRRERWSTAPEWKAVQAAIFNQRAGAAAIRRRSQKIPESKHLLAMFRGIGLTIAAAHGVDHVDQVVPFVQAAFRVENRRKSLMDEVAVKRKKFSQMEGFQVESEADRLKKLCGIFGADTAFEMVYGADLDPADKSDVKADPVWGIKPDLKGS